MGLLPGEKPGHTCCPTPVPHLPHRAPGALRSWLPLPAPTSLIAGLFVGYMQSSSILRLGQT